MIKAVIFDLDGVLRDSEGSNLGAAALSFQNQGFNLTAEDNAFVTGRHPADYLVELVKKYPVDVEKFNHDVRRHFLDLVAEAKLFPFVKEVFKLLKHYNIKIALATSSPADFVEELFLKKYDFGSVFDVVITFDDCDVRKPEPLVYDIVRKRLELEASECLVVEDTAIGVKAAKAAGMVCVAVPNEYTKDQDFTEADQVIKSLGSVSLDFIKKLGGL
ncbi:HAD family phosphatase [Candidatus Woesearchaeota archaeon]|jgi:HAD superfamily hydrolase (TIGR01509 family)|nr:HAD family phosphatase [Candidatus Woesearchaeota archaeon]MBT3537185.1 HAD family phosphatase [Candidatus Woesearchaeota archaeon]MBT4696669.1 HAD family phosphatase [Candidatus Woesearchaeota archaeon]MBT4716477.1 HAD family phosphatase [Candidatus Woesearchaeota archaeon]MBT7106505.1 HAD family phosphatase [Candidatus Woesearchaeota archaeon]